MPNSRYYTPQNLKNIFEYAFPKIDFSVNALTRDTGCTAGIDVRDDRYVMTVIEEITSLEKDSFKDPHNSHDWVKMLKHVFQNGQIINFRNLEVFRQWKEFSTYTRNAFLESENPKKLIDYNSQFKRFMAKLIQHGAINEAKCIHQFLSLAYAVHTRDASENKENNSEKVAAMLGGTFYDALQLEGIVKNFSLLELDKVQRKAYIKRVQHSALFLKNIIEDSLFSTDFNPKNYFEYLSTSQIEKESDTKKYYSRNRRSVSLDITSTLDPELVDKISKLTFSRVSKSNPSIPSFSPEITFSHSSAKKMKPFLNDLKSSDLTLQVEDDEKLNKSIVSEKKRSSFNDAIK